MIVLIVGDSGVGKSTIVGYVAERMENINIVKSYTTRPKRNEFDNDHTFIKSVDEIDGDIVASTEIDGYFYGASDKQFDKNKINLYIVDDKGVVDVIDYFDDEIIMTVHIKRDGKNIKVPVKRKNRKIEKMGLNYDVEIENDDHLLDAVRSLMECIRKYQKMN